MTRLEEQIKAWHDECYGPVSTWPTYRKLLEEVGELAEALASGDETWINEEAGDVAFVLTNLIRGACPRQPSLAVAMTIVLKKNLERLRNNDACLQGSNK